MNSPEHSILLACARICSETEIITLTQTPIDWDYLLEQADTARLSSLLYRRLYSICPEKIPASVLDCLRNRYLMRSARNLLLTTELLKILDLFDREGIPAVPFKGPVLAAQLYEDAALREFNDIDILVSRQNAFKALRLLQSLGYPAIPEFSPAVEFGILRHDLHYHLLRPEDNVAVEIHWTLVPKYFLLDLPLEDWWKRMEPASFNNHRLINFAREDLLLVLAIQCCKHRFQYIQWIGDLARFLQKNPDLDWNHFLRTSSPDLRHILFIAVLAAHETLNAPVPKSILKEAMADSAAVVLAREALRNLFKPAGKLSTLLFQFRLKPTLAGRISCFLAYISKPMIIDYKGRVPRILRLLFGSFWGR
jgi:hypothetical protein